MPDETAPHPPPETSTAPSPTEHAAHPASGTMPCSVVPDGQVRDSVTASGPPGYVLGELLGRGGMGVVYRATDAAFGRAVAVKLLCEDYPPGGSTARRFLEEVRITGQLQHPGIPPVHATGEVPGGRPYLVMKLIKGRTLHDLLTDRPDPAHDRGRFVAIFEAVCQAVGYAHAHGVIHRDLKPANVMVGAFGEVQVMDWGLAKVLAGDTRPVAEHVPDAAPNTAIRSLRSPEEDTDPGAALGTPAYMAPEQATGAVAEMDPRTDVFGLGAVLCSILTGQPPYVAPDAGSTWRLAARAKLADAFDRLDGSGAEPELVTLAKRCLSSERDDRPQDAGIVAAGVSELRAAAAERARQAELDRVKAEGERATAEVEVREQRKRRRVQLALAVATAVLAVGVAGIAWRTDRERASRRHAVTAALDQVEAGFRSDRMSEVDEALARATERVAADDPDDIRSRLGRLRRTRELISELDNWNLTDPNKSGSSETVSKAFGQWGLSPTVATPDEAATLVNDSPAKDRLIDGLDLWLSSDARADDPVPSWLRAILARVDPDPYRTEVRKWVGVATDYVPEDEKGTLTPGLAAAAIRNVVWNRQMQDAVIRVLRKAWAARPGSFDLTMQLASRIASHRGVDSGEAAGFFRVAIVLRPGSPAAWARLGRAVRRTDPDGAVAAHRRALELDPTDYARYADLAHSLIRVKRYAGALSVLEPALSAHPEWKNKFSLRDAACAAVRAGTEGGVDPIPHDQWPAVRAKALGWLTEALGEYQSVTSGIDVPSFMDGWLRDSDLSATRPGVLRIGMPAAERAAWDALWADVRATRVTGWKPPRSAR